MEYTKISRKNENCLELISEQSCALNIIVEDSLFGGERVLKKIKGFLAFVYFAGAASHNGVDSGY